MFLKEINGAMKNSQESKTRQKRIRRRIESRWNKENPREQDRVKSNQNANHMKC